jgi:hypothetical protein
MLETVSQFVGGLGVALQPENLAYCFIGALIGTLIGVLPGLGPVATVAMLLPVTFHLPPIAALIMLAGIYYGPNMAGRPLPYSSICRGRTLGSDMHRRSPDGATGAGRPGSGNRCIELTCRR